MKIIYLLMSFLPLFVAFSKAVYSGHWGVILAGLVMSWLTYQMFFDRDLGVNFEYKNGGNQILRWLRYLMFVLFFLYAVVKE